MCKIILSEKTNVCKYEVFDRNEKPVNETTAVYNKSKEGLVEIEGEIKMGNIYYLKTNETEKLLYLTDEINETNTWNHTEPITIKNGEQKERKITIKIEDQKFFDFFLVSKRKVGDLRCNGGSCCKFEKENLKILNYSISESNKTLWLHVNKDFNYNKEYRFSMGIPKLNLNSTLTLRFNETKIQKESLKEGAEINYQTSLALGIATAFFLFIVGLIIIFKRRKSQKIDSSNSESIPLDPLEDIFVEICDRKFPKSTVKEWIDIKRGEQLGSGHFGNVYKGFLHLSEYQR